MSARLWSLGVLLVALGIAATVVGWDAILWLPRFVLDSLAWVPGAVIGAARDSPITVAVIAAGILLMLLATLLRRRGR
jgi:hypothetical protein